MMSAGTSDKQRVLKRQRNVRLAQLDRAFGYGPKGRGFESSNARCKRSFVRKTSFLYVPGAVALSISAQLLFLCKKITARPRKNPAVGVKLSYAIN